MITGNHATEKLECKLVISSLPTALQMLYFHLFQLNNGVFKTGFEWK